MMAPGIKVKPLSPAAKMLLVYFTYFIFVAPAMPVPSPYSPEATDITQPLAARKKKEEEENLGLSAPTQTICVWAGTADGAWHKVFVWL